MGGGVARAIKRVGGKEIETQAMRQVPTPVGKAVATTAWAQGKIRHPCPTMERPAMSIGKRKHSPCHSRGTRMRFKVEDPKYRFSKNLTLVSEGLAWKKPQTLW
jgi:hypothetical protein